MTTSRSAFCSNASAGRSRFREQMAIVGFNDLEFMASAVPTLTQRADQPLRNGQHRCHDGDRGDRRHAVPNSPVLDLGFTVMERQSSRTQRDAASPTLARTWPQDNTK